MKCQTSEWKFRFEHRLFTLGPWWHWTWAFHPSQCDRHFSTALRVSWRYL